MSESISSCQNSESIETAVLQLGETIATDVVVIGSSALKLALPESARQPRDIDLSVSEEAFRHMRLQPQWHEVQIDGQTLLTNDTIEVGIGWAGQTHNAIYTNSWQTQRGIAVTSLSQVYAYKNQRHNRADQQDMASVRARLQDASQPILADAVLAPYITKVAQTLPEHLRDDPAAQTAIKLAANGVLSVYTQYGDPNIGKVNQIIGDLELPEFGVAATYHNGFDVLTDMETLQTHLTHIGATDEQRLQAMVAEAYSDIIYGNGRQKDNPQAYDELRSARLLTAHATMAGYSQREAEQLKLTVLGTTFSEQTGTQVGHAAIDPVVRAVAGVDLHVLSQKQTVATSFELAIEDNMSARYSAARIIGKVMAEKGVRICSVAEGLAFIDENAGSKPGDVQESSTVMQAFASRLANNARFHDPVKGYQPPADWSLENREQRVRNAQMLTQVARLLNQGSLSATTAYSQAQAYAAQ